MSRKTIGTVIGAICTFLWFAPLINLDFMGMGMYQTGAHIGGIAYLMLLCSISYAIVSWMEQHIPRIIAASLCLLVCFIILIQVNPAWGLIGITVLQLAALALAIIDQRSMRQQAVNQTMVRT